jgi:putative iron-dependent peroxidase
VTGSLFFVPTATFLDDPPALPGAIDDGTGNGDAGPGEETVPVSPDDGSLGIGGLTGAST